MSNIRLKVLDESGKLNTFYGEPEVVINRLVYDTSMQAIKLMAVSWEVKNRFGEGRHQFHVTWYRRNFEQVLDSFEIRRDDAEYTIWVILGEEMDEEAAESNDLWLVGEGFLELKIPDMLADLKFKEESP